MIREYSKMKEKWIEARKLHIKLEKLEEDIKLRILMSMMHNSNQNQYCVREELFLHCAKKRANLQMGKNLSYNAKRGYVAAH